jgi:hypothetical protein
MLYLFFLFADPCPGSLPPKCGDPKARLNCKIELLEIQIKDPQVAEFFQTGYEFLGSRISDFCAPIV